MAKKRILFVGGGGIGERHIRCFLATGEVQASVCEIREDRMSELQDKYPISRIFTDFGQIPLDEFDAAVIAVPAHLHIPMALACARHGLPFLLEKPLSVNLEGVDELLSIIAENNVYATVGFVRRSQPCYQKLRELALSGLIGELQMARFHSAQEFPKYRPDYRETYYAHEETGGGCILDGATHFLNLAEWVFGEVQEVVALYDRLVLTGVECEDSAIIVMRFRNNSALVEVFVNQFQKPNVAEIELIGTKGNLRLVFVNGALVITHCADDSNRWEELCRASCGRDDPFIQQARDVLAGIDGKAPPITSVAEAAHNLRVLLAAKRSQNEKAVISLAN